VSDARVYSPHQRKTKSVLVASMVGVLAMVALAACGDTGTPPGTTAASATAAATPTALVEAAPAEPTDTPPAPDGWATYSSPEGFSVDMPGQPQETQQTTPSDLGDITVYFFQVTDGPAYYAASYNDYPLDMSAEDLDPDNTLSDAWQGVGQSGEIVSTQPVEVQGYPGVEGEINVQDTSHIWYRGIMVKDRLYQLVVTAPEAEKDQYADGANRFIESFTLDN
jgi:hypothetical protein